MTPAWTDDEVEAMVHALREGATYSDVAAMLGRTRGAIAGCIRRYTLERQALPVPPVPPATEAPGVSLLALKAGMCKWPVREARWLIGGFAFCAMPVDHSGASYCSRHRRLATSTPPGRRAA